MLSIPLPGKPKYVPVDENTGKIIIEGCHPGYGTTLGNALRRVILSSLEGVAISSVKIKGASHEFVAMDGILEDVVQIILNLKKVRFKMHGDEPIKVDLKYKGEGKITAGKIKCSSDIEVINKDQLIATATNKKAELELEMEVTKGLGYVPVEQQIREEKTIGVIAIDAIYTPVRRVNYQVENMRVGKRTDYNKITLEITTDGTISPKEAYVQAARILVDQCSLLVDVSPEKSIKEEAAKKVVAVPEKAVQKVEAGKKEGKDEIDPSEIKVADLKNISTRTLNVLETSKIKKVKDILRYSEEEIKKVEGMGDKGIKEIRKSIGEFGFTLKQK